MLKRESMITTEEKLLFDILQELKQINQKLTKEQPQAETVRPVAKGVEFVCKACNTKHENRGKLMACYKKHKKEGAKNDGNS